MATLLAEIFIAMFAILMIGFGVIVIAAWAVPSLFTSRPPVSIAGLGVILLAIAVWGLVRLVRRRDLSPARRVGAPWMLAFAVTLIPMTLSGSAGLFWKTSMVLLALLLIAGSYLELSAGRRPEDGPQA